MEDLLDENTDKNILITGHYPVFSLGEYGGHHPLKHHFVPFLVLGSFITSYRQSVGTADDIVNENYEGFREFLEDTITYRSNLIYLSAHDLDLQIIRKELIVSSKAVQ